jgi:hypothetical protein
VNGELIEDGSIP